jgi:hypothetical protein
VSKELSFSQNPEFQTQDSSLFVYLDRHVRTDKRAEHASGASFRFLHAGGMESGGAEMLGQSDHLMGTRHDAQFASFAPLFVNFYSWHINSLPRSLKKCKQNQVAITI